MDGPASGVRCGVGENPSVLGAVGVAEGDDGDVASPLVVVLSVCCGPLGRGAPASVCAGAGDG
nr:hypothetical protein [Saccharomonospora azurea]